MAYITRDDGVQFVVPSYRDVLTMKSAKSLKKEIISLSSNYGEYITLQQKGAVQFEVAFSPDTGYLLGESIWHNFKRPMDFVYCEAVPNTSEAILVIVVAGGVYLDGRFQVDSIPDELIVFLTQKNNFDIYIYGDVPISEQPEPGKFSFESHSIKSFNILEEPVFQTLPLLRIYQLQLVENVLKEHKIGVFPVKKALIGAGIAGIVYFMWNMMGPKEPELKVVVAPEINPYVEFNQRMTTPDPVKEISAVTNKVKILSTMPGWRNVDVMYAAGALTAKVTSDGTNVATLNAWAQRNDASLNLDKNSVLVTMTITLENRPTPKKIFTLKDVMMTLIDRLGVVYPGNHIKYSGFQAKGVYKATKIEISFEKTAPDTIELIGEQLKGLPVVLTAVDIRHDSSELYSGSITFDAVGN